MKLGKLGLLGGDVVREKLRVARGEPAEGAVEHPADVVLGVVDDPVRFLVPKDGNGDAAVKSRIGGAVGLGEEFEAVDGIVAVARAVAEGPTALVAHRIDHGHADDVFQPLQMPDDDRATSPRDRRERRRGDNDLPRLDMVSSRPPKPSRETCPPGAGILRSLIVPPRTVPWLPCSFLARTTTRREFKFERIVAGKGRRSRGAILFPRQDRRRFPRSPERT